jgi:hypothetical protein
VRSTPNKLLVAALFLLGGCPSTEQAYPGQCMVDQQCDSDQVCARNEACASPSSLRDVYVHWTIDGAAPTDTSCQRYGGSFELDFVSNNAGEDFGFDPVPCNLGTYHIDKMPTSYFGASLDNGRAYAFDVGGMVTIPL